MLRAFVLILLLAFGSVSAQNVNVLDPNQIYTTGNLTTFNQNGSQTTTSWQNVGKWGGGLTCWNPFDGWIFGQYCGPQPYVNSNGYGNINFSYGYTDLHQIVNIANALPNSGTGLRVNGFNFGFQAKNGNGWDNSQQDYLVAYVNFYGSDGKQVQSYNYGAHTNQRYNWNYFSFSETFTTPYASKELSTARYGFVGYDTNGWAGPYGPEVNSVSFSLKYSVDPCSVNVLSSPSCPGYLDAISKYSVLPTTTNTDVVTTPIVTSSTTAPTTSTSTDTSVTNNTSTSVALVAPAVAPVVAAVVSSPSSTPNSSNNTSSTSTSSSSSSSNTKEGSANMSNGVSIGLSIIAKNQERENAIVSNTVQMAVSLANSASQQAQQDALNTANAAVANSLNANAANNQNPASGSIVARVNNNSTNFSLPTNSSSSQTNTVINQVQQIAKQNTQTQESYAVVNNNTMNNIVSSAIENVISQPKIVNTTQQNSTKNTGMEVQIVENVSNNSNSNSIYSLTSSVQLFKLPTVSAPVQQNNKTTQQPETQTVTTSITTNQTSVYNLTNSFTIQPPTNTAAAQKSIPTTNTTPVISSNSTTTFNEVITYTPTSNNTGLSLLEPTKQNVATVNNLTNFTSEQKTPEQTLAYVSPNTGIQLNEMYNIASKTSLTDKSNPVNEFFEGKGLQLQNNTTVATATTVNKSSGDNEVANGVDINKMAILPIGYADYTNLVLRDVAFYAPKEVYRNQRNVDNARALRQLTNDTRHQEMVEQQYRR